MADWRGSDENGNYLIVLAGVEFPPGDCDGDGLLDPEDNDIDGDNIPNAVDSCDYTPLKAKELVIDDSMHPLYGSLV